MAPPALPRAGRDEAEARPPRPWALLAAALLLTLAIVLGPRAVDALRGAAPAASASGSASAQGAVEAPRWSSVPDPRRASAASLAGTVASLGGGPIAGARVCAEPDDDALTTDDVTTDGLEGPPCAATDATGAFAIQPLVPARYRVSASAPGHRPARWQNGEGGAVTLAAGEARASIGLTLTPGGVVASGRVLDASSAPIADALVTLTALGAADVPSVWVRTGVDGAFSASVDEGEIEASADALGFAHAEVHGVAPTARLSLVMLAGAAIEGRVVVEGTFAPVPSAVVSLSALYERDGLSRPDRSTRAGADGTFRVAQLVPGIWQVDGEVLGAAGSAAGPLHLVAGATARDVIVVVHPAHVVSARLLLKDGASEVPCAGGELSLTDEGADERYSAVAGGDGEAVLRAVAAGTYAVEVSCPEGGSAPGGTLVVDRDRAGLVFAAPRGLGLVGAIVDDAGAPIFGATVDASLDDGDGYGRAITDERGRFAVRGLTAGRWSLAVRSDRHVAPAGPEKVSLREGAPSPELRVVLRRGATLEGTLVDLDGAPIAGADVIVEHKGDGGGLSQARTRDDGSFRVEGLADGAFELGANLDHVTLRGPDGATDLRQSVTVSRGTIARARLIGERLSGSLRGRVVDASGAPLEGVLVDAHRADLADDRPAAGGEVDGGAFARWQLSSRRATTDADGRFRLDRLPCSSGSPSDARASVFEVRAIQPGGARAFAPRVPLGGEITLTLRAGKTLRGVATLASGAPLRRFRLDLGTAAHGFDRSVSIDAEGGAFAIDQLREGTYTLELTAAEGGARAEVTVGEGGGDVRLVVRPLAVVRGRLVWFDDGAPLADGEIEIAPAPSAEDLAPRASDEQVRYARADATGAFEIHRVGPGAFTLRARARDGRDAVIVALVTTEGSTVELGTLRAARTRLADGAAAGWLGLSASPSAEGGAAVVVSEVEPGGPAAAAGLLPKSEIVAVEGVDVRGQAAPLYGLLTEVAAGARVRLTLADGRTLEITAIVEPEEPPTLDVPEGADEDR